MAYDDTTPCHRGWLLVVVGESRVSTFLAGTCTFWREEKSRGWSIVSYGGGDVDSAPMAFECSHWNVYVNYWWSSRGHHCTFAVGVLSQCKSAAAYVFVYWIQPSLASDRAMKGMTRSHIK
jgi:hypothetical protein